MRLRERTSARSVRARPTARASLALVAIALCSLAASSPAQAVRLTGRQLVVFEQPSTARSASALEPVLARAGVRRAGRGVPRLGIATVRGPAAALARLRRDPSVQSVSPEWQRDFRRAPNDPAVTTPETEFGGLPGGAAIQWNFARQNFPAAWAVTTGVGAIVGVLDSGIDGGHPQVASKLHSAEEIGSVTGATVDEEGHGTHVSGLACAATNDGVGTAGAGWDCRLAHIKVARLYDEDIIAGIDQAVRRGADAINMSFGGGGESPALERAIDNAVAARVVLVAAAANGAEVDQGAPASQLQPNDAPNIAAGRGLVVTAVDFLDRRAGTGRGPQISLSAYGFYDQVAGPPGIVSTYPGRSTPREAGGALLGCQCRRTINGDPRYAYLQGSSMAAPQVAGLAAMIGQLNPFLTAGEKIRLIKETARRSGGWNPDVGWGIVDAGRAVDWARRIDRTAPASRARARKRARIRRPARRAAVRLRWSGADRPGATGLLASGVATYELYARRGRGRYRRVRRTARRSARLRLRRGVYRFYTRARDRAGNLERKPRVADVRVVVTRSLR